MPCTDGMPSIHICTETIANNTTHEHNHSHENGEDNCPPFCTCQCCGSTFITTHGIDFSGYNKDIIYSYSFHYSFLYSLTYSDGVWRPPNLV